MCPWVIWLSLRTRPHLVTVRLWTSCNPIASATAPGPHLWNVLNLLLWPVFTHISTYTKAHTYRLVKDIVGVSKDSPAFTHISSSYKDPLCNCNHVAQLAKIPFISCHLFKPEWHPRGVLTYLRIWLLITKYSLTVCKMLPWQCVQT